MTVTGLALSLLLSTDWYVNDTSRAGDVDLPGCAGMDAGAEAPCGTCAAPCAHLQDVYDTNPLKPGDTVWVNTGRYLGTGTGAVLSLADLSKAGDAGALLRFIGPTDSKGGASLDDAGIPLALIDGSLTQSAGVRVHVPYV